MSAREGLKLLDDPTAVRLPGSTALARRAYARDGTPRVISMLFAWIGHEVVFGSYAGSVRPGSLRADPAVAITVDTPGPPPGVLPLRGRAEQGPTGGIVNTNASGHRRYYGEHQGRTTIRQMRSAGTRMVRIAVRPSSVGPLDYRTSVPGGMS